MDHRSRGFVLETTDEIFDAKVACMKLGAPSKMFVVFHIFVKLKMSEINQFMLRFLLLIQPVQILIFRAKKMEIIFGVRFPRKG